MKTDEDAIKKILKEYAAGYNSGDVAQVMSLWTEDGIVLATQEPAIVGKKAITAWKKRYFDQFTYRLECTSEEIGIGKDWAFNRGTYTSTATPKSGGRPVQDRGKFIQILRRESNGSWKIARDMGATDLPQTGD
ncbi:MAG TPA: DUF4440 domain-containing protein [Acidobacteriota bacterium]|jgi:uncharacterized protein (TIGR02246 family)